MKNKNKNNTKTMKEIKYWNAILLAILGGGIGLQEFYLGRYFLGILAVLFCWTGVPAIIALIEAIVWLFDGEDDFYKSHTKSNANKPLNS